MNAPTTPLFAAGLTIHSLGLGPIGTNCYVLHRPDSECAVVVDPGAEATRVLALLEQHGLTVEAILLTHSHWDHVGAVADLAEATAAPVWISAIESMVLADLASFAPAAYGPWRSWTADRELVDGETFTLAGIDFEALVLPGHSPGSIGYLVTGADPADDVDAHDSAGTPLLVIGDVIFRDSVGRTDLPFGDTAELMASCRRVLDSCSDDTLLVPGHGPETTVGREREHNPYLRQALAGA